MPRSTGMPVYLSGHLCQAPKLELLDMIEECGTNRVDTEADWVEFLLEAVRETGAQGIIVLLAKFMAHQL